MHSTAACFDSGIRPPTAVSTSAAVIDSEIVRYEHQYPNRPKFLLIFYRVREFQGEPVNLAFQTIVWERPERLRQYEFLDGDIDFIRRLARGEL